MMGEFGLARPSFSRLYFGIFLLALLDGCERFSTYSDIMEVRFVAPGQYRVIEELSDFGTPWDDIHGSQESRNFRYRLYSVSLDGETPQELRMTQLDYRKAGNTPEQVTFSVEGRLITRLTKFRGACKEKYAFTNSSMQIATDSIAFLCNSDLHVFTPSLDRICSISVSQLLGFEGPYQETGASGALNLRVHSTGELFYVYVTSSPNARVETPLEFNTNLAPYRTRTLGIDRDCRLQSAFEFPIPDGWYIRALGTSSAETALVQDLSDGAMYLWHVGEAQGKRLPDKARNALLLQSHASALPSVNDWLFLDDRQRTIVLFFSTGRRFEVSTFDYSAVTAAGP